MTRWSPFKAQVHTAKLALLGNYIAGSVVIVGDATAAVGHGNGPSGKPATATDHAARRVMSGGQRPSTTARRFAPRASNLMWIKASDRSAS
jgi:hypothetical protein